MKRIGVKALSLLLFLLMLTSCMSGFVISASADDAGITSLSVSPSEAVEAAQIDAVNWFYSSVDQNYYLFLPSTYDKSAVKVWFTATDAVYCGGAELVSGAVTDAFANGDCTLTCAGTSYHVILLDGGDVASVQITTESGSLERVHADKSYKDPGSIVVTDYDGAVQYDGALDYIKGRGNSTWNAAKKPYNIKLAKKADLFGMGKAKKWCLLANAGEATMMRDLLAYRFSREIGLDVTSDVIPVNLYVNGQYMGAYVITEKVEIGDNRVAINDLEGNTEKVNEAKLDTYPLAGDQDSEEANSYQYVDIPNNPEDITGGYLLELEKIYRYPPEASGFITSRQQAVVIKEPEYCSKEEVEYIRGYYQEFEDALYSPTGYNSLGKHFTEYADLESIARIYVAEEFGANFDGCSSSFFLYKDIGGKITAGPAWDFDLSFRQSHGVNYLINNTCALDEIDSLYIQHCYINWDNLSYRSFLGQLFNHEEFQQTVQNVWNEVVKEIYPDFFARIAPTAEQLHSTVIMNAIRWNTYGSTNPTSIINGYNNRLKVVTDYIPARYDFLSTAYSEDTYFVKYDIGTYGTELIIDTNIYQDGDTAVVLDLPNADMSVCPEGWYLSGDYTGEKIAPGSQITVDRNVNLYAKWNTHHWEQSAINSSWQHCTLCDRYACDGALLDGWYNSYHFKNGKMIPGEWVTDENGTKYIYEGSEVISKWRYIDGKFYYFGSDGYVYTGTRYIKETMQAVPTWYAFGADGAVASRTRIRQDGLYTFNGDLYYVIDGYSQYGVQMIDGDCYFFKNGTTVKRDAYAVRDQVVSVTADNSNDLLEAGSYYFDADGKLVTAPVIVEDKVYVDGKQLPAYYGLVMVGDDYYYIADNAKIVKNKTRSITSPNGLTLPSGTAIKKNASYTFDEDGKMIIPEGIVGNKYYIGGDAVAAYYGLVFWEGDYYYVAGNGNIVRSKKQYTTTTNDLCLPDGTKVPHAYYDFDADGKMIYSRELIGDYYYINGKKVSPYYGLIKVNNDFYYVGDYARIVKDKTQYLTTTNSLTFSDGSAVPHAYYYFDENGKMLLFTGLKDDRYYVNGTPVGSYYGLVKDGEYYYYIGDYGMIVKNKSQYLTTTNGLKYPDGSVIPNQYCFFDEYGRMERFTGIRNDHYYISGDAVGSYYGLVKYAGNFYYIGDNAVIVKNKNKYLTTTNGLTFDDGTPIPNAYYAFDADGRMVIPDGLAGDCYYLNGVRVGSYYGLVKDGDDFYYIGENALIIKNKKQYLTTTNGLTFPGGTPIPHQFYRFDSDGKMVY